MEFFHKISLRISAFLLEKQRKIKENLRNITEISFNISCITEIYVIEEVWGKRNFCIRKVPARLWQATLIASIRRLPAFSFVSTTHISVNRSLTGKIREEIYIFLSPWTRTAPHSSSSNFPCPSQQLIFFHENSTIFSTKNTYF